MGDHPVHLCVGEACPFIVDTGEGLVCSKTGIVVADLVVASFDYFSTSSQYKHATRTPNPISSLIKIVSSNPEAWGGGSSSTAADEKHATEEVYGECFRVVSKLLKEDADADAEWRDALVKRCVETCSLCLTMDKKTSNGETTKGEYLCLAVLYLIREGLTVKGTVVCEKDPRVTEALPSLNALARYGFKKGKYTKASRFLLQVLDKTMLSRPLHKVRV